VRVADTPNSDAAVAWLRAGRPFDVVLLDHGLRAAEAIRAAAPGVPIVLLAPFGRLPGTDRAGVAGVLTKPLRPAAVFRALAGAADTAPTPTGAPLRVLVADDHPVNQRLVLLQLTQLGHHADLVSGGVEAVTAVGRRHYDVVLMDVEMPDVDGLAATRQIRAQQPRERRPWIVAVTAHALPGARAACLSAGMDDYLTKPLVSADLAAALARAAPALDPAALDRLREVVGGDAAALSELVTDFLNESPLLVDALHTAVDGGDAAPAQRAAHTLHGLGATFGATALAHLCRRAAAHGGLAADLAPVVAEIAAEHERVALALRRFA